MNQKMSGLESMRLARANRERQTVEPLRDEVQWFHAKLTLAMDSVLRLEQNIAILGETIRTEVGKDLLEGIRCEAAMQYQNLIEQVLNSDKPVTVTVPQKFRHMMDPSSKILGEIAAAVTRSMVASGRLDHDGNKIVTIEIPKVTFTRVLNPTKTPT